MYSATDGLFVNNGNAAEYDLLRPGAGLFEEPGDTTDGQVGQPTSHGPKPQPASCPFNVTTFGRPETAMLPGIEKVCVLRKY